MRPNPFRIGDSVRFVPDEHAKGWSWFGPGTLQPDDAGVVSRIQDGQYLYIKRAGETGEVGGFHWECFTKNA